MSEYFKPLRHPVRPLAEIEMHYVLRALASCQFNRTQTAKALGVSIRTLRCKLDKYRRKGIEVPLNSNCACPTGVAREAGP